MFVWTFLCFDHKKRFECASTDGSVWSSCHNHVLPTGHQRQLLTFNPLVDLDHITWHPTKRGCLLGTGTGGGRGRKSEGSTAENAWKRPERPWTAAWTMEVLWWCSLAIAQQLVHRAIAVSTAVLGQSHKNNVHCTAVEEQPEAKEVWLLQPSSTSLLMISSGLTWGSSSTSLLLISPGTLIPWLPQCEHS